MKRITQLLFALSLVTFANGQGTNTVYQTFVTNSVVSGAVLYGPVRSVGQASHQALISLGSIPGHTCSVANIAAAQFSVVLVGYQTPTTGLLKPIPQLVNAVSSGQLLTQGTALFPNVYVQSSFVDPSANCNYSVYYDGATQGLTIVNNNISLVNTNTFNNLAAGTTSVLAAVSNGQTWYVFGYQIALGSGGAATVEVKCHQAAAFIDYDVTYSMAVSTAVQAGSLVGTVGGGAGGSKPLFSCGNGLGENLDIIITGAGATASVVLQTALLPWPTLFLF